MFDDNSMSLKIMILQLKTGTNTSMRISHSAIMNVINKKRFFFRIDGINMACNYKAQSHS